MNASTIAGGRTPTTFFLSNPGNISLFSPHPTVLPFPFQSIACQANPQIPPVPS
jgi:hypothetical protein